MLRWLKASLAAPNTTTSSGHWPRGAASAASRPFMLGVSTEWRTPAGRGMPAITCGVVGHLRHPLRADEAGDLDLAAAGGLQAVDEFDLLRRWHRLRFVLQAVARADLDEGDVAGNHGAFKLGRLVSAGSGNGYNAVPIDPSWGMVQGRARRGALSPRDRNVVDHESHAAA